MDSAKLNDWLQVIGLFGVIASLLFVGLQMKQDREIALSAISQARTENTMQSINDHLANPYWMSAMDKIEAGDVESINPSERRALSWYGTTVLYNFENIHFQYISGFITTEHWAKSRETLKSIMRSPAGTRTTYETTKGTFRSSFEEVLEDILVEIDAESATRQ